MSVVRTCEVGKTLVVLNVRSEVSSCDIELKRDASLTKAFHYKKRTIHNGGNAKYFGKMMTSRRTQLYVRNIGRLICIWYQSNTTIFVMYKICTNYMFRPFLVRPSSGWIHLLEELPYILESNPHLVFADFLNEKKVSSRF